MPEEEEPTEPTPEPKPPLRPEPQTWPDPSDYETHERKPPENTRTK